MENWDEVIIKTDFMKGLISRLISKAMKEKSDMMQKFRLMNWTSRTGMRSFVLI